MAQDDSAGRSFDLPEAFLDYLTSTPYSAEEYHALLQSPEERYVRIRDPTLSLATIAQRLQVDVTELVEVSWTKRFAQRHPTLRVFRIPETAAVRQSDLYDSGDVFGVDASSIACVGALDPEPCDHVLEICCAPGTKLCCLADLCTVTGVDINRQRLTVARSQVKRCKLSNSVKGLWLADGRSWAGDGQELMSEGLTPRDRKQTRKRPKVEAFAPDVFDGVLVDAECAHDGSLKHIRKFFDERGKTSKLQSLEEHMPWLSEAKRTELAQLQFELLCRGFQLLKEGGKLIYCTCSFSEAQNEEVIRRFLVNAGAGAGDERHVDCAGAEAPAKPRSAVSPGLRPPTGHRVPLRPAAQRHGRPVHRAAAERARRRGSGGGMVRRTDSSWWMGRNKTQRERLILVGTLISRIP
ncbi:unnamed protein product [Durusdinium trenchii]|uniref:SAM-dependent MTase RsmB/NOP-type domain-containing protein n=1 Tax=Durusdinium trenchii TaxID=1381693 RepID=A0ABP0HQU7_9DINO